MTSIQDTFSDETKINVKDGSEVTGGELRNLTDDNSLEFDGLNDYIDLDAHISSVASDTEGTISAWINLDDLSDSAMILAANDNTDANSYVLFYPTVTESVKFIVREDGATSLFFESNDTLTLGEWYHVVVTVGSSGNAFYINGEQADVTYSTGSASTQKWYNDVNGLDIWRIGNHQPSGGNEDWFDGKISQVKYWSRALTDAEVRNLYQTGDVEDTSNQVSYWKIDEGTGTSIADSWGSNTGTLSGGTWRKETVSSLRSQSISTDLVTGLGATQIDDFKHTTTKKGGGVNARLAWCDDYDADRENVLSFDGSGDYIDISDPNWTHSTGSFGGWIKTSTTSNVTVFGISDGDTGNNYVQIWVNGSDGKAYLYLKTASLLINVNSDGVVNDNHWHHVYVTQDGATSKMYINGTLQTDTDSGEWIDDLSGLSHYRIGNLRNSASDVNHFLGKIADFRVYDDALTADEVLYLYTNGKEGTDPTTTNLVSHWKIDEGSGTSIADSHGSNDGTTSGSPSWETDYHLSDWFTDWKNSNNDSVAQRACYDFDGVNDYIEASVDGTSYSEVSFSVWFKTNDVSSVQRILSWKYDAVDDIRLFLLNDDLYLSFDDGTIDQASYANSIEAGKWYHAVGTYSSAAIKLYLNGIEVAEDTTISAFNFAGLDTNFYISGQNGASFFFNGKIFDPQIYSSTLSASEVWDLYTKSQPKSTNQVSRWKLNGNALDSWGSNDGTVNGATVVTGWENCPPKGDGELEDSNALDFDGVNDIVTVTDDSSLQPTTISISAWVKSNSDTEAQYETIVDRREPNSPADGYILHTETGTGKARALIYDSADYAVRLSNTNIRDGDWYQVVMTYDGSGSSGLHVYVNGALDDGTLTDGGLSGNIDYSGTRDLIIGNQQGQTQYWDGEISNVAIWNDARTASEIQADYQNGYIDTSDANLVSYWKLDEGTGSTATDSKGSNDGTISGASWTNNLHRPAPDTAQRTISLASVGGSWNKLFYKKEVDSV